MGTSNLVLDLAAARGALAAQGAPRVVRALREWALRWCDPAREVGEEGLRRLSASTGWPRPHLMEALRRAFSPWAGSAFERAVVRAWTGRIAAPSSRPDLWLLAILAGRIPALATGAAFRALAAGVPAVLKPSSAEPVFCELLVRSAQRHSDLLGRAVRVVTDPATLPVLVREAPACLAYGRDDTVARIRKVREGRPTWCGGHRESLAVVFREAASSGSEAALLAARLARDCAIYDQSGCLSPHVVLYEEGGAVEPERFAEFLVGALQALDRRWPPASLDQHEAATLRLFLDESRLLATRAGGVVRPERGPPRPAVVLVPGGTYRPAPGGRVLQVLTFRGRPDLGRLVPSLAGRLQGLAFAGPRARLDEALSASPSCRVPYVCRLGRLQRPPPDWRENGWDLTRELVRAATVSSRP